MINTILSRVNLYYLEFIKRRKIYNRTKYIKSLFSARSYWYLSRNFNPHNRIIQATVYKWNDSWNIARYGVHHEGYATETSAKKAAFKMFIKDLRRVKHRKYQAWDH
jgi:hypothetical protein